MNKTKPILFTLAALVVASCALLLLPHKAQAQASGANNAAFRTAAIQPSKRDPGTNCFVVFDKTGTNWFCVNPTNATLAWRNGGTLYTGVTATITILNTNATTNFVLKVKNGLILDGP